MKNYKPYKLSLLFALFLIGTIAQAQTNVDYTVQTRVVVTKSPPSISIRWAKIATGVTSYSIFRKSKDDQSWGAIKGSVAGTDTMWTDTDVALGQEYEYNIQKLNGATLLGITYLLSGFEVPVVHHRGNALVVIEKTLAESIPDELQSYMMDIASDGWQVYSVRVSKTDAVQFVKSEINRFEKLSGGLTSVILLGHIPVPYSGNFGKDPNFVYAPDGHVEHSGCWPADVYYAIDYDNWTDTVTNTDGIRPENKNLPGDGKFDNTKLPGKVKYFLGRIDLSNLPLFPLSEVELTKQYFRKAHNFRFKKTITVEKGVVDDRFEVTKGAFGSLGWRNFTAMFGPKNIIQGDLLQNCAPQNLLFAYGAGGGTYTECGRVCATDSFLLRKGAIFNMLFGSNFGDWDNKNNLLRAPLAATENGLTNAWSGRPHWQNHAMALGYPIGYCAMITQNNTDIYSYNYAANAIHIALMGDPTLRLHYIEPPTNVIITAQSNNTKVNLHWTASNEIGKLGYYIYSSNTALGNYQLLNSTPISDTVFTDELPYEGDNYYQVKTLKLTTSASGSYFNTSVGTPVSISGITGKTSGIENPISQSTFVYPNPAHHSITIHSGNCPTIELFNCIGILVKSVKQSTDNTLNSQNINIDELSNGLYFIKIGSAIRSFVKE